MELFPDPVGLGLPGLRSGMNKVLDGAIQFILVSFGRPTILRNTPCPDP